MEGRSSTVDRGRRQTVAQSQSEDVSGLSRVCAGVEEGGMGGVGGGKQRKIVESVGVGVEQEVREGGERVWGWRKEGVQEMGGN